MSEKMLREIAGILGDAVVADMKRNPEKYRRHDPARDTQADLEPQQVTGKEAKRTMDETVNLDWQRFSKLTEARSRFAKTSCVYVQADSRGCPIRVGKASEGLEARYRGGTGYAIDAAMHESGNPVFVAAVEKELCGLVEDELIWQGRRCLRYNNQGKIIAPLRHVRLLHSGMPPILNEFETGAAGA